MAEVAAVVRERLVITGIVQGVGFRPHVATLAVGLGLSGRCHNDAASVVAEVEGPAATVADFVARVVAEAPPLARIRSVLVEPMSATGTAGFVIEASDAGGGARTMVPPDAAVCDACLAEMSDPADRRYRHPFITCTHCGPRLTITRDLPYDRLLTTMAGFPMCADCAREYADPFDRRYHAQPISCHACGPTLRFLVPDLSDGDTPEMGEKGQVPDPISRAQEAILAGRIVAVKGIGGYHLVCDATSDEAVARLRERKHRPDQPFAVMVASLEAAARIVTIPAGAETLLTGIERPIVLLPATGDGVSDRVAPALDELGVMLPYAPLHHLLLDGMPPLVMTSGNRSGEPLAYRDQDALDRLTGIADAFLTHDRPIAVPCDDSVLAWASGDSDQGGPVPLRRSRGYAPLAIDLPPGGPGVVYAAGSELKSTFALLRDGQAFLSGHLGDLGDLAGRAAYATASDQVLRFHRAVPDLVVADQHPGYASRAWAADFAASLGVPLHLVQHHHAHLASLAAEHGRMETGLVGLVLDGTGYACGVDGEAAIWGGELLRLGASGTTATRLGHLRELPLPGGDAGVRNPARIAAAALTAAGVGLAGTPLATELTDAERTLYTSAAAWPTTSSAGRLFDVVSALLGVRGRITYEAQAAIELEHLSRRATAVEPLPAAPIVDGVLDTHVWLRALARGVAAGAPAADLGLAFHVALADGLARLAHSTGTATVGLSGGVFANRLLLALLSTRLRGAGIEVLTHRVVPAGDGGLSLGQAAIGHQLLRHQRRGA